MFTGIVMGQAKFISFKRKQNCISMKLKFPISLLNDLKIGDSVSNNGCCLTVQNIVQKCVLFDIIEETLQITNFKFLKKNCLINIERALKINSELGGHLVSGHITGTVIINRIINNEMNKEIWMECKNFACMQYIFEKGCVCINGVSLTVGRVINNFFSVFIIPETFKNTNFLHAREMDCLNLEIDYITQVTVDTVNKQCKDYLKKINII
ncbi:riboflavin synthase subunit alpha [Buchnera aphidicola (Thelaxes californica)]|uniref:Riboflavin synthase n=1 Tax=Buchnera aphidicola (Thelaxes californica) TaxID=1315998 RepID=A0A4D6YLU8_9GAMM|nr:riboflavin synthase subunit alpha [Buchnera aphidicola]QCI26648.1 riboflavin synthase subunit alpha [Buchnera aphidicola (Thelaxes californica)]